MCTQAQPRASISEAGWCYLHCTRSGSPRHCRARACSRRTSQPPWRCLTLKPRWRGWGNGQRGINCDHGPRWRAALYCGRSAVADGGGATYPVEVVAAPPHCAPRLPSAFRAGLFAGVRLNSSVIQYISLANEEAVRLNPDQKHATG